MPVNLGVAKLCVCAGAGALIGGAAVHVAEKPKPRPRVAYVAPKKPRSVTPAAAPAPLPCEPMMTPELTVRVPAAIYGIPERSGPAAPMAVFPISAALPLAAADEVEPADAARLALPADVPEPAMLGLLALGVLGLAAGRRRA